MNGADFLTALYGDVEDGWLESTFIAPKEITVYPQPRVMVLWRELPLGEVDPAMPRVHSLNRRGYGCYFGLAVRKEKKLPEWRTQQATGERYLCKYPRGFAKDSLYLTAFFADIDAKDLAGGMAEAYDKALQLNPSILVNSGGGYHAYFRLNQPLRIADENRLSIKRTLRGISKTVGGDMHVAELARVFRLPDTINTKPDRAGALCSVVHYQPDRIYTFEALYNQYSPLFPLRPKVTPQVSEDPEGELEQVANALLRIPADSISYGEWFSVLAGLTHALGASEAARLAEGWSGWCSDPGEIESKIQSIGEDGGGSAGLGSVFWLAKRYGYTPPKREDKALSLRQRAGKAVGKQRKHNVKAKEAVTDADELPI